MIVVADASVPRSRCRARPPDRRASQAAAGGRQAVIDDHVIEVIPRRFYVEHEAVARRRVPRDPNGWAPVALALAMDVGILTGDQDFLGCGRPTWTVETLRKELDET